MSKQETQGIAHPYLPSYRFWKLDQLLLIPSLVEYTLFVPLA